MFASYRIGKVLGFPIRVNLTFLLMLGVVLLWMGGLAGLAVTLLAFGSVLLHELGHAVMARHLGVQVADIELHFFGGAARMTGTPRSPGDEIAIAAAGPAVSFALAGLGLGLGALTGVAVFQILAWVNLFIGAFNLIPAFPSDGGRILRALLAKRHGFLGATELAVKVARVAAIVLVVVGLTQGLYQLAIVAAVLWMMGSAERLAVRLRGEDPWAPRAAVPVEYIPPGGRRMPPPRRPVVYVWRY
jgi:stage IV sporulation protein FB